MSKSSEAEQIVGCASAMWSLCVTCPMWLVLLFTILSSIDVPSYAWVLFWCYLPAHIVASVMISVFKVVATSKEQP